MTAGEIAELIDFKPQQINELVKKEKLHGVKIGSVQYVSKEEFIEYVSSTGGGGEDGSKVKITK